MKLLEGENLSPRLLLIDIEDDESVKTARDFIKDNHGSLDVLVNNAGFAFNHDAGDGEDQLLRRNLLFPLLTPVNVSSSCGQISMIDGENCDPSLAILN